MNIIFRKEMDYFFTSVVGYVIWLLFLLTGIFMLFFFKGEQNLFDRGIADLQPFFEWSSWLLIVFLPALTMRSFSFERQSGTLELLYTRPISVSRIVLGKYMAVLCVVLIMMLPTLGLVWMLSDLTISGQTPDYAVIAGSYFSLFLLASSCIAIGLWSSSLTKHQMIAFVIGVLICFLGFYGLGEDFSWGMKFHFDAMSRGVLDSQNVIYFLSLDIFFVFFTVLQLKIYRL